MALFGNAHEQQELVRLRHKPLLASFLLFYGSNVQQLRVEARIMFECGDVQRVAHTTPQERAFSLNARKPRRHQRLIRPGVGSAIGRANDKNDKLGLKKVLFGLHIRPLKNLHKWNP